LTNQEASQSQSQQANSFQTTEDAEEVAKRYKKFNEQATETNANSEVNRSIEAQQIIAREATGVDHNQLELKLSQDVSGASPRTTSSKIESTLDSVRGSTARRSHAPSFSEKAVSRDMPLHIQTVGFQHQQVLKVYNSIVQSYSIKIGFPNYA
jgi:hypothetical protein